MGSLKGKKIKFGLIGFGSIAPYYIQAIRQNDQTEISAVCDNQPQKRKKVEAQGWKFFTDCQELVALDEIDAVIVATPNSSHAQISVGALLAGKPVICEKPMAINLAEAREMAKIAERTGLALMPAFHNRFHAEVEKLRQIGKRFVGFRAVNSENLLSYCSNSNNVWYFNKAVSGGGCIIDSGINFIDVIYEFIGPLQVEKVEAEMKEGVEIRAKVYFSQGVLDVDWESEEIKTIVFIAEDGAEYTVDFLTTETGGPGSHMIMEYEQIIARFLQVIEKGADIRLGRSLAVQEIIEKIYGKISQ